VWGVGCGVWLKFLHLHLMIKAVLRTIGADKPYKFIRTSYYRWKLLKNNFTLNKNIQWFGLPWCGFYLDITKLRENAIVFSFGVGADISFDLALYKKGVHQIYLFDPTLASQQFINKISLPPGIQFDPIGLSDQNEFVSFYLPIKTERISGSAHPAAHLKKESPYQVQMHDLPEIMQKNAVKKIDILKLDIEGSEFKVIENIFALKIFPEQICVEFHQRFFEDGYLKFERCLQLFRENNYVHCARSQDEGYLFCLNNTTS